ncbi:MAG: hypothetical protein BHW01_02120 [Clostridium sp. 27_14]|nr:MAG: hypothetical protein BHW01_02120 [Clostridium sp. 27_14]
MIIVSQDKGKIINFDNMTRVYITFDEGDDDVCIRIETVDSLYEDLGYYKTEGRAKEVLQEIVRIYVLTEQYKVEDERTRIKLMMEGILLYEMPKD